MKTNLAALLSGLLFGFGLIISDMVNPIRVKGFLDLFGNWDLSLAFVMLGALLVASIGYFLVFKQQKPLFDHSFHVPLSQVIDKKLIFGAAMFGIGWGLSGLCPGPALVSLTSLDSQIILFVISMFVGMKLFSWFEKN